jgi:hypothetical protein
MEAAALPSLLHPSPPLLSLLRGGGASLLGQIWPAGCLLDRSSTWIRCGRRQIGAVGVGVDQHRLQPRRAPAATSSGGGSARGRRDEAALPRRLLPPSLAATTTPTSTWRWCVRPVCGQAPGPPPRCSAAPPTATTQVTSLPPSIQGQAARGSLDSGASGAGLPRSRPIPTRTSRRRPGFGARAATSIQSRGSPSTLFLTVSAMGSSTTRALEPYPCSDSGLCSDAPRSPTGRGSQLPRRAARSDARACWSSSTFPPGMASLSFAHIPSLQMQIECTAGVSLSSHGHTSNPKSHFSVNPPSTH